MKTKTFRKVALICGAVLIGIVVCMSVWFFLREHKGRDFLANNQLKTKSINTGQEQKNPDENQEDILMSEEKMARDTKFNMMSMFGENRTPMQQKILEAMNSPDLLEVMEDARENGPTTRKWFDFLESQGVSVNRDMFNALFQAHFHAGEPEDYEPEMRLKMAKLFLSTEQVDLTDPIEAHLQRLKVFTEFSKNEQNMIWHLGQFGEDWDAALDIEREGMERNISLVWITDVQQNAANIVASAETARVDTPQIKASASSWDMSSVMESPSVSSDTTMEESPSVSPPVIDALEPPAISNSAPDVPKALTELPTVEGLETILKSQFSSERFEQAMDTLDRYGPEEGLRRLREGDPEVANQIERHRNRSRSEDSDKSEEEVSR